MSNAATATPDSGTIKSPRWPDGCRTNRTNRKENER